MLLFWGGFSPSPSIKSKHIDTFNSKIQGGRAGEDLVAYYLREFKKKEVVVSQGFTRDGDLLVNKVPVEVKTDFLSFKTGNVAIEHQSLLTHTAPYYIYLIPHFYWTTKEQLQGLVDSWPDRRPGGDDGRLHTIIKINTATFAENFTKL